jgi:hypothetical protein
MLFPAKRGCHSGSLRETGGVQSCVLILCPEAFSPTTNSAARRQDSLSSLTAALPSMTKNLALQLAPVRVNDTPLSASLLGDELLAPRIQLMTLPIRPVVGPTDVAAPAVHDQHSPNRRNLRHRRRPAACRVRRFGEAHVIE